MTSPAWDSLDAAWDAAGLAWDAVSAEAPVLWSSLIATPAERVAMSAHARVRLATRASLSACAALAGSASVGLRARGDCRGQAALASCAHVHATAHGELRATDEDEAVVLVLGSGLL